jgi:hypothetical protein
MKTNEQLFTPEFIAHARDLRRIKAWFLNYLEKNPHMEDNITHDVLKIESCLNKAAYHISELVAMEFNENVFYEDLKGGVL